MSQLLPYETIVKASEGDPEAVAAVLSHYAGYIRSCAKMDGQINTDMQEQILSILRTQYMNLSVLLTLGEHGAIFVDSQGIRYHVPSVPCVVKDTTAAGDTFTGYFLTSYFKDYDVSRALAIAAAASSIAVSREGAASSIPYQCEVLTYMK